MANGETKRQHYVPRVYLKRFGTQKGQEHFIHALPKETPTPDRIFEPNIKNVGIEKDLYTLPGDTPDKRMLIENIYSDHYEQHYDQVYAILTDSKKTKVTDEERQLVLSTVVTMFYRTTKWINSHNEFMRRGIHDLYSLAKQTGKDSFTIDGEKLVIGGKTEEQLFNEIRLENKPSMVMTQLEVALKLIELRNANDGIYVIKLDDGPENEFITSDNPVSFSRGGTVDTFPFDPKNILSLPLDNKHILMLMPYAHKETRNLIIRRVDNLEAGYRQKLTANFEQWTHGEKFIFGTESGLKAYLSTKEETERPLTEEELAKHAHRREVLNEIMKRMKALGLI